MIATLVRWRSEILNIERGARTYRYANRFIRFPRDDTVIYILISVKTRPIEESFSSECLLQRSSNLRWNLPPNYGGFDEITSKPKFSFH